jgi:hypothetical protein
MKKKPRNRNNPISQNGCRKTKRSAKSAVETSLTQFVQVPLARLRPAKLNDKIYKTVHRDAPETKALVDRMRQLGWIGAMAVTKDWVIVSGHRRRVAAMEAGISKVTVEILPITSNDPRFPDYLVTYNEQRKKSPAEEIQEQIVLTDPGEAYQRLIAFNRAESRKIHQRAAGAGLCILTPASARIRAKISPEKRSMLDAAIGILNRYEDIWPLTLRQVHYRMLVLAILRNAKDPRSVYVNDRRSYQDLSKLLVRARLAGDVPFEAIEDETRPITNWKTWGSTGPFVREHLDKVFKGYRRNLQQSQSAFTLLFVEKMTVQAIAQRAASPYHVPVFVGRGYPSLTSVHAIAEQFRRSGKDRMVLLGAGDHDPEGLNIVDRLAASLRDEFGVFDLTTVRVALNADQVRDLALPPLLFAKESSSRAAGYVAKHGANVYELEAVEPDTLQQMIGDAIEGVLDMDLIRRERVQEVEDAREMEGRRNHLLRILGEE